MKALFKYAILLIYISTFISCNGQTINANRVDYAEKVVELNKIPVPKHGFSSGFIDKDGTIWFGGRNGIWKYDGHAVTEITTSE